LSMFPGDILDRMQNPHFLSLIKCPSWFVVVTLRRLILSNNNLAGLPPNIRSLVNLEYLDISRNPLRVKNGFDDYSCLPREFRYLRNLQTFIMTECTLKHIPAAIWNAVSPETLDISQQPKFWAWGQRYFV
jgi:Leucine-rich repeat (LRR) protein